MQLVSWSHLSKLWGTLLEKNNLMDSNPKIWHLFQPWKCRQCCVMHHGASSLFVDINLKFKWLSDAMVTYWTPFYISGFCMQVCKLHDTSYMLIADVQSSSEIKPRVCHIFGFGSHFVVLFFHFVIFFFFFFALS